MDLNTQLKPTVVSNPHPLIGDGRVNYYEGFKAGETLGEYVARVGVEIPKGSFVVIINGCVAMHDWRLYVLQEGDDIIFRSSALGGGGGGKVLRLVAMVALVAISAGYGASLGGALGLTGDMAAAVGGALIMTAGTLIVNAIFPPPKPQMPSLTDKEQSPTYGISSGRNQANPYGPMLIVFGRHKVVPFLASKTYTTFDGDNQYLSQAFHFGLQPDLNLEKIRIGDTDITAYQDVQVEKSTDNGRLSLVSGNIDVLEGFEVYKSSGWVSRTTPNDTTHISIDIASNLFDIADNGDERTISVGLNVQYKKTGSTTWLPLSGGSVYLSGSNPQKPTRLTINQPVEKGQYDIRISKTSDDISTTRKSNKVTIAQIRCTQSDNADYTGQLRVAVKIKATSQLNGAIDELSAIASAKCQVWNGGAWEVKETSNPAWWFLWWARGKRDANFKRLYGECLPDNRIDIEAIKAWAAFCDRKNLTFNWVLDRKMSIEEVYYTIARAGRASTTWQTGKRGVIWDSDELPVTTLLTPANIIAGSFSYKHINTDVADEIILNYYDANKYWEKAVVRQKVPNATQANNPITLDLEGCTNESQAGREANLLAASQQLHRKQYSFEMDIEGAVLTRGDVAQLTHDLTSFAAGGRLVAVNGNVLTLDADVGTATNAWLTLRSPFNKMYNVRVNAKGNQLTLVNGWTFGDVGNVEDWLWQYDPSKIAGVKLQIKSVVPQSNGNIKFEAIEYSPDYFAAENNVYFAVPQKQARDLPAISVFDALATERVLNEQNGDTEVTISWVMSELADASVVIRRGRDVLFNDNVHGSAVPVVAREGDTLDVEIVPFADRRTSRVFNKSFVVIGTNVIVPAPTGLKIIGAFTKSAVTIKWDRVINAVGYEVQVLSGSTVRRTVKVGDVLTYTYAFADMSQDGGAVRSLTFKVRALGQRSAKSSWVSVSGKNPQVAALQGIKVESNIKSLMFTCEKPQDEDFAGYLVWISDNKSFVPTLANVSHDGSFNQVFFNGFNGQPLEQKDYYIWCAGYDAFGKDELNISGYFVARPVILKLDPQSIAAEMIQDGALTMTKFAQGIKPPRIVQKLPASGELNDLVVLERTSTMYRWDGTRWNSQDVVPPDGSITNAKLANGAVNASKIASGAVTNGAIANGAITNAKLGNGSVSSTKLSNGAVGNAHLQTNSVSAANIVANAINNSHLQANSVGNSQLQNNAVGAFNLQNNAVSNTHIQNDAITDNKVLKGSIAQDKLLLSSQVNLIPNGAGEMMGPYGWADGLTWVEERTAQRTGYFLSGKGQSTYTPPLYFFDLKEGEKYLFEVTLSADVPNSRIVIELRDRAGAVSVGMIDNHMGKARNYLIDNLIVPTTDTTYTAIVNCSKTSGYNISRVYFNYPRGTERNAQVKISNMRLRRMVGSDILQNGAVGTNHIQPDTVNNAHLKVDSVSYEKLQDNSVGANKIQVDAVQAKHILANSIGAEKIASNAVKTNHLQAGAVVADKLATNSVTAVKIASNAVTASKLAVMGDNLILDPSFSDRDYWGIANKPDWASVSLNGKKWIAETQTLQAGSNTAFVKSIGTSRAFPVKEGERYFVGADIWVEDGAQAKVRVPYLCFYKNDDYSAYYYAINKKISIPGANVNAGQNLFVFMEGEVPEGCTSAKFFSSVYALTSGGTKSGTVRIANPVVRLMTSGELIVDGAITAKKIQANAITADKLAANSVTSDKVAASAIATNHIQVGAVGQTQIKPDSINTGHLIAGSVTAPIIAAGAVGADQIAANAISAKHLMIGDLSNLVLNGNQQRGLEGYSSASSDGLELKDPDSGSPTGKAVILKAREHYWGDDFDVSPGAVYFFKFACFRSGEAKRIGLGLRLKDKDNKTIGYPLGAIKKTTDSNSWGYYEGLIEIPANAVKAKVFLQIDQLHTDRLTKAYVSAIEVRRASHGTMIKDGSITTLKLKAGEIEGNVIKANTLNGDKIIGNSIHGDKITMGTIDAKKLNVKQLSAITSNLGSVNAGSININNRFLVSSTGNVSIKSADSGARMVINNNRIEVYDSNNRLRVRMGIW